MNAAATSQRSPDGGDDRVVLLMGPTGAGKTDLAIELAEHHPFEIISVDSAMVYRGMDIGTAKPAPDVLTRYPHHLIDIRDPADSYSVGQFLRDAQDAMRDIRARGKTPLFVGGTMLYFHSLLNGLAPLPQSDPAVRRRLARRAEEEGWPALHAELSRVDPAAAARIHPNDPQRIQRALEVHALSGAPLSVLQARRQSLLENNRTVCIALCPSERTVLHERIAKRLQVMLQQGFVEEVRQLRIRGDLTADLPALRAVGYRQIWGCLEGAYDLAEAERLALTATRQLAKRQLTWLRGMEKTHWFDPTEVSTFERLVSLTLC